jgi:hypothetical protein
MVPTLTLHDAGQLESTGKRAPGAVRPATFAVGGGIG